MPSLKETQHRMQDQILKSRAEGDFVSGKNRLFVYSEGYVVRLQDVLADTFSTTARWLGDRFDSITNDYVFSHPSHSYNINIYGADFPKFLEGHPQSREFQFLPDLARLEWLIGLSFNAADARSFDPQKDSKIKTDQWENAKLSFQSWLHLVSSAWPIQNIWLARKEKDEIFLVPRAKESCWLVVFRRGDEVFCDAVDQFEFDALAQLMKGSSIENVCAALAQRDENAPIFQWFSKWTSLGWITECKLS